MQVPHNAFVVVADGRKMLFLRNEGDAVAPNLQVEKRWIHPNAEDSDQKTDASGQASSAQSGTGGQFAPSRGTMGETDFHQLEEDRFAADTAALLKDWAMRQEFEQLIVVAPPKTLGELRKHYHHEVSNRLAGELDKDLTGHTVPQIEEALLKA